MIVTGVSEPLEQVSSADVVLRTLCNAAERLSCSGSASLVRLFDDRPGGLDRIEVRRVGGQILDSSAGRFDDRTNAGVVVRYVSR